MSSSKNRMRRRGHLDQEEKRTPALFSIRYFIFSLCAVLVVVGIIMIVFNYTDVGKFSYKGAASYYVLNGWIVALIGVCVSIFAYFYFYRMKD